jgi:hypothetical protein
LLDVDLPCSVRSIGKYAFGGCSSLVRFGIGPDAVLTDVGEGAFAGCSLLSAVVVPARLRPLVEGAFEAATRTASMGSSTGG